MDRGGGSGRGGPSRQGSSLPRTLHGSLLHTDTGEEEEVFSEEAPPVEALEAAQEEPSPYPVYATSSARSASVPYSSASVSGPSPLTPFEQGSSRGPGDPSRAYTYSIETQVEQQQPPRARQERNLALPPFRTQAAASTDPELYASSVVTSRLNFNYASSTAPPLGRPSLPPVSSLDSALGSTSYAGSSSQQFYTPPRGNTWDTAPHPYAAERPMARTAWSYPAVPEHSPPIRTHPSPQELSSVSFPLFFVDAPTAAVRKIPKKTPIACNFCRGRKLKCDGRTPTCGHCEKRRQPCTYVEAVKRRGPGKAPKGHRKGGQQQKADRPRGAAQGPGQPGPSSSPAASLPPPLPPSVSPEDPYTRYQGMYMSPPPATTQAAGMGSMPSRIPLQPPYPSNQFDFTYPAPPRQTSSAARAAYERNTFSDDFGLPQQLSYPAPGPSQVEAQAFEPPRVPSSSAGAHLQEGWPGVGSAAAAARHDHDEDRGSRAREPHEYNPYDPRAAPAGSARAPGPGRER